MTKVTADTIVNAVNSLIVLMDGRNFEVYEAVGRVKKASCKACDALDVDWKKEIEEDYQRRFQA